jgi:AsmA protein
MRRIFGITLVVFVVLLIAVMALPFLIPMEAYRTRIADAASRATGREVQINGPLRLSIYPEIGVSASAVSVSNFEGAREPQMGSVETLVVGVRLWPLLSGRMEVARLILEKPVIHLEVAADGTPNWAFAANATPDGTTGESAGPNRIRVFGIERLSITDGLVTYYDVAADTGASVDDVDVTLSMPSIDAQLTMDGALTYNTQRIDVDATFAQPRALLLAEGTAAHIALASQIVNADFSGTVTVSGRSIGAAHITIPSLRDLAAWSGTPLPPGETFGIAELEADLTAEPTKLTLSRLRMALDGMTITGELTLDSSNPSLLLGGGIAIDRLDLNAYLTRPPAPTETAEALPPEDDTREETAPLQLAVLKTVNADMTLSIGTLLVQNLTFERAALGLRLNEGLLNADLRELSLYGGMGHGALIIDAREAVPSFRQTLSVSDTQVQPFLTGLMAMDRLSGTGTMTLDLSSRGTTQDEIVSGLSGAGRISVANGALRGIDIAAVSQALQTVVNSGGLGTVTGDGASTDFTDLGGTFRLQNGIAYNEDFQLLNPLVRVAGNGEINLAARTMDFFLEPQPAVQGAVGGFDLANIGVPFRVHGPWADLSYTPDMRSVTRNVLEGLFGNGQDQDNAEGGADNALEDAGDALRSLFGLGGR